MRSLNPRTGLEMTPNETIIYDALCEAAREGRVCPDYLDLSELCGFQADYHSSKIVSDLKIKGMIEVDTCGQVYRRVRIVATGQWTARHPDQKSDAPHIPRGTHDSGPLMKALHDLSIPAEVSEGLICDFRAVVRLEKLLNRAVELTNRRKNGFLLNSEAA